MIARLRRSRSRTAAPPPVAEAEPTTPVFTGLRLFTAKLLLSTGVNATLYYLRERRSSPRAEAATRAGYAAVAPSPTGGGSSAAAFVPAMLGTAACAMQVRNSLMPSDRNHAASTLLNGAVVGMGVAGAAEAVISAVRGNRHFSVAPLLFGYTGVLGFLLDREEDHVAEHATRLEHRARIVERFVPRRRTKIDKIVVRV